MNSHWCVKMWTDVGNFLLALRREKLWEPLNQTGQAKFVVYRRTKSAKP